MNERIERIKSVWEKGDTATVLARKLNLSKGAIIGTFQRHEQALLPCHLTAPVNSAARQKTEKLKVVSKIDKVKSVWKPGDSAQTLADKLGWSKAAVVQFFIRNRQELAPCTLDGRQNPTKHVKPIEKEVPPPETMIGKSLVELDDFDCRFPVGEIFCGNPSTKRHRYCNYHNQIVYRRIADD